MSPITASPASATPSIRPSRSWGVRANSRSEDGNVKYDYFFDAQDPDVLLLVETWTEPALQEAHCRTETFDKLQILKAEYCDSVTADKFYD